MDTRHGCCANYLNGRGVGSRYDGSYPLDAGRQLPGPHAVARGFVTCWPTRSACVLGHNVWEGERVDHVDVEDGADSRVVIPSWPDEWLDSEQSYLLPIP